MVSSKIIQTLGIASTKFFKLSKHDSCHVSIPIGNSSPAGAVGDTLSLSLNKFFTDIPTLSKAANNKFREAINALIARNPSKNADSDKIQKLITKILNNPNYKKEEDLITYLNNIRVLASKRAPNGETILNSSDVFAIADFKGRQLSLSIEEVKDLIKCVEEGRMPFDTLKHLQPDNPSLLLTAKSINPLIKQDIEKLKYAKNHGLEPIDVFIPKYQTYNDAIKHAKTGEMFSIRCYSTDLGQHDGVFIFTNNNGQYMPLCADRETVFNLLPPVKRYFIQQFGSGTCYQLASYITQMQNPRLLSRLFSGIKNNNGKLTVQMPPLKTLNMFRGKFSDFDAHGRLTTQLVDGRFNAADKTQSVRSNPIIKALEHLYGKHRKYDFADKYVRQVIKEGGDGEKAYNEALKNMEQYVYIQDETTGIITRHTLNEINAKSKKTFKIVEDYYKNNGGNTYEVLEFMQDYVYVSSEHIGCDIQNANKLRNALKEQNAVAIFGSKHVPSNSDRAEKILVPSKSLYSNHAYNITGYDEVTDTVQYINPWNSAFVFEMQLPELTKYVNNVSTCKVR